MADLNSTVNFSPEAEACLVCFNPAKTKVQFSLTLEEKIVHAKAHRDADKLSFKDAYAQCFVPSPRAGTEGKTDGGSEAIPSDCDNVDESDVACFRETEKGQEGDADDESHILHPFDQSSLDMSQEEAYDKLYGFNYENEEKQFVDLQSEVTTGPVKQDTSAKGILGNLSSQFRRISIQHEPLQQESSSDDIPDHSQKPKPKKKVIKPKTILKKSDNIESDPDLGDQKRQSTGNTEEAENNGSESPKPVKKSCKKATRSWKPLRLKKTSSGGYKVFNNTAGSPEPVEENRPFTGEHPEEEKMGIEGVIGVGGKGSGSNDLEPSTALPPDDQFRSDLEVVAERLKIAIAEASKKPKCRQCRKRMKIRVAGTAAKQAVINHVMGHLPEGPFRCLLCATSVTDMHLHWQNAHSAEVFDKDGFQALPGMKDGFKRSFYRSFPKFLKQSGS